MIDEERRWNLDGGAWSHNQGRALWARGNDGTNTAAPDTVMTDEISPYNLSSALWTRQLVSLGLSRVRTTSWATEVRDLPADADYLAQHDGHREGLVTDLDAVACTHLHLSDGRLQIRVAARDAATIDSVVADLRVRFPVSVADPAQPRVAVTFWSLGANGPVGRTRQISVPGWCDIDGNYSDAVTEGLLHLVGLDPRTGNGFQPGLGGQLLLWHGPPGTGKTWALRALAWEWRAWADLHYITDPETFFGDRAAYMLDVLLHDHGEDLAPAVMGGDDATEPEAEIDPRAVGGRWKLLVLEDTGELMSADARDRSGQGLSRLLNVVDGLIGQGLKVLVLVTTNEELKTLHPAVQRPGRCASKVLFGELSMHEARGWLQASGMSEEAARDAVSGPRTVADLFAVLESRETSSDRERAPVGFAS